MPINHVIFIPFLLGVGFYLGWKIGVRGVHAQWQQADEKRKRREEAE